MLRYKRLILNTPTSKIRGAAMGTVELTGMTSGTHTIPAGITGEPCYYYRATAWELRQSGNRNDWKRVANESLCVPFFLEDATGKIPVNPQGADLDLHRNFKDELGDSFFSSNGMLTPNIALFLARNNVNMSHRIRLEEYCIKPGFPLFILGTLAQNSQRLDWTPEAHVARNAMFGGRTAQPHAELSLGGTWAVGVIRQFSGSASSDAPSPAAMAASTGATGASATTSIPAGGARQAAVWSSVSADEMEMGHSRSSLGATSRLTPLAGAAATRATTPAYPLPASDPRGGSVATSVPTEDRDSAVPAQSAPILTPQVSEDRPPAMIAKGTGSEPFIISWRSQKEVVASLAWKSALCIWGGPAVTLVSFYALARIFGWI